MCTLINRCFIADLSHSHIPGTIREATWTFQAFTAFFDACHGVRVLLIFKDSITKPANGKIESKVYQLKRALLWVLKGPVMAVAQVWSNEYSTLQHGVMFILLVRSWIVFCLNIALMISAGPWALQVAMAYTMTSPMLIANRLYLAQTSCCR